MQYFKVKLEDSNWDGKDCTKCRAEDETTNHMLFEFLTFLHFWISFPHRHFINVWIIYFRRGKIYGANEEDRKIFL